MAKIIVATPNEEMYRQAVEVAEESGMDAKVLMVSSQTVLERVRAEREGGALVVVARGNHAHLIKTHTDMPLIEVVLTGQELALLIEQATARAGKPRPRIGLVGFCHMFSDPEPFARILGADVRIYYAASSEALPGIVDQAREDGVDVIIGGEIALRHAERLGLQGVFLRATKGSLAIAMGMASRVLYGIELERRKTAEFMSLLNYSFDAILKLDSEGRVLIANYMAEKAFRRRAEDLRGLPVAALLELAPDSPLALALQRRTNAYSMVVRTAGDAFVANLALIQVEGKAEGFILSMQEFRRIEALEERVRTDRYPSGSEAKATFGQIKTASNAMRRLCEDAAQYAQYDLPVLITGAFGSDKAQVAQCIHNAGNRRKSPYVSIDVTGLSPAMQRTHFAGLRGEHGFKSVFENAHTGTLYIEPVDLLTPEAQLQLLSVLRDGFLVRDDGKPLLPVNVRVLCATARDLGELVQEGTFFEPLYRRLSQLELRMPSLRERIEDIPTLIEEGLSRCAERYRKFVTLTPEAQALLHAHPWEGDALQLSLFLEKLVILARDKELDRAFVERHLPPARDAAQLPPIPPVLRSAEVAEILVALENSHGSRLAAARALGISKTTLWRRMKKHGIAPALEKE